MVMLSLFTRCGYRVGVAHCNFQLRGAERRRGRSAGGRRGRKARRGVLQQALRDAGPKWSARASRWRWRARRLRYAWFDDLEPTSTATTAIAIAHHADDSIETFFINLLRGTGLRGLTGISTQVGKRQ
ncbi:MAG: ATP-binding protein [Alistipes shahii]